MWQEFKSRPIWASMIAHQADAAAFSKALKGDEKAARKLIASLSPKAHALAWRILGESSEAEDIVQAAFIKLFEAKKYDGKSALSTYMHTIVTRLCFDKLRASASHKLDYGFEFDELVSDGISTPLEELERKQSDSNVQYAMQFLNARQRAALALWAYHDATISEIAKATGLEVNAAHQLLHRAKINLRKKMEHLGYE
jgi:RNA polymerase sigma-70 factor (ECF subfamily)